MQSLPGDILRILFDIDDMIFTGAVCNGCSDPLGLWNRPRQLEDVNSAIERGLHAMQDTCPLAVRDGMAKKIDEIRKGNLAYYMKTYPHLVKEREGEIQRIGQQKAPKSQSQSRLLGLSKEIIWKIIELALNDGNTPWRVVQYQPSERWAANFELVRREVVTSSSAPKLRFQGLDPLVIGFLTSCSAIFKQTCDFLKSAKFTSYQIEYEPRPDLLPDATRNNVSKIRNGRYDPSFSSMLTPIHLQPFCNLQEVIVATKIESRAPILSNKCDWESVAIVHGIRNSNFESLMSKSLDGINARGIQATYFPNGTVQNLLYQVFISVQFVPHGCMEAWGLEVLVNIRNLNSRKWRPVWFTRPTLEARVGRNIASSWKDPRHWIAAATETPFKEVLLQR